MCLWSPSIEPYHSVLIFFKNCFTLFELYFLRLEDNVNFLNDGGLTDFFFFFLLNPVYNPAQQIFRKCFYQSQCAFTPVVQQLCSSASRFTKSLLKTVKTTSTVDLSSGVVSIWSLSQPSSLVGSCTQRVRTAAYWTSRVYWLNESITPELRTHFQALLLLHNNIMWWNQIQCSNDGKPMAALLNCAPGFHRRRREAPCLWTWMNVMIYGESCSRRASGWLVRNKRLLSLQDGTQGAERNLLVATFHLFRLVSRFWQKAV